MKYTLIFFILFYFNNNLNAQKNSNSLIIGKSIKIERLEIAQYDFPNTMSWSDAKKGCNDLGEGWRLPTKDELYILYLNKKELGNFTDNNYWSISNNNGSGAWSQNFSTSFQNLILVSYSYNARCIKPFIF